MFQFLSYAEGPDPTDSNLTLLVIALGIIGVVGLLAAIPATIARRRVHRHREGIVSALVLWAVLLAGSGVYSANAQISYSKEYNRRVMSGYFDPRDKTDAPKAPWVMWIVLAAVYGGVLMWILSVPSPGAPGEG
jgi:hypothetical protein